MNRLWFIKTESETSQSRRRFNKIILRIILGYSKVL